ncbi:KIF-binding protein isoform X2 [Contarinia nasturtii]|uniref:KIF-binding protein isoform X2 n=1 Tax=Contarinia nasturtii TaxID=265458 RepID=UPI0012D4BE8E|nr:KIF-binding protein isoform X2 [Contarinia nasturtii]
MTLSKELLVDLKEKYEKTEVLVIDTSKLDPPTEPFKSHYEARKILLEISQTIKEHIDDANDDIQTLQNILAHVTVDLGKIYNFTEELSVGEKYLNEALELVKNHETDREIILIALNAMNECGVMWMNRGETEKAKEFLINAETNYNTFKEKQVEPLSIHDIFNGNTTTQVFGSLKDLAKSAIYCHTTLKKQLIMGEFEAIDWALNAATLSQYFCTNNRYSEARHHLAAATQILLEHQTNIFKPGMTDDEKKAAEDNFNHRVADLNRCWIKYALNLISDSRDRLLEEIGIESLKVSDPLKFGLKIDEAYENIITDRYLLDMDDAKPVFLTTIKWVEKAKSYYTIDTEATEYSKIVQDHAMAYKHLAFFESDPSNQAKMHKRRIDLLEDLLKQLNKLFYMNIVRELLYELGTAYSNILDIKLEAFEQGQKTPDTVVNPNALKKINELITKSRNNFSEFISTYYQAKTEQLKSDISNEELVPIAFSYFQIARISYKFITPDKHLQYQNLCTCLESYKKFVDVCTEKEEIGEKMKGEVGVSKEMIHLLPLKLQRLKGDIIESGVKPAITA